MEKRPSIGYWPSQLNRPPGSEAAYLWDKGQGKSELPIVPCLGDFWMHPAALYWKEARCWLGGLVRQEVVFALADVLDLVLFVYQYYHAVGGSTFFRALKHELLWTLSWLLGWKTLPQCLNLLLIFKNEIFEGESMPQGALVPGFTLSLTGRPYLFEGQAQQPKTYHSHPERVGCWEQCLLYWCDFS